MYYSITKNILWIYAGELFPENNKLYLKIWIILPQKQNYYEK